jgi:hypothetical protein
MSDVLLGAGIVVLIAVTVALDKRAERHRRELDAARSTEAEPELAVGVWQCPTCGSRFGVNASFSCSLTGVCCGHPYEIMPRPM